MTLAINKLQQLKDSAKSFAGLMALYESNYIRFMQLVPQLDGLSEQACSVRSGDISLQLQVLERSRFTTTCHLTYLLDDGVKKIKTPDLKIRIYHDARQAEVMCCNRQEKDAFGWLDRAACVSNLQWRWRLNRFLYKWLNYCLKQGHGFPQQNSGLSWKSLINLDESNL
ncbi:MAG: DUF1249 domain-containing protein [Gammaproteobacteria bacterium]|nr:MAG: DUF1249 domain-containing protein [Gammaproteobacteria bacterium]